MGKLVAMEDQGWRRGAGRLEQPPLLTTKFYVPEAREFLVSRPRLMERLDQGRTRKLVLVSAPAGFGKTTLVASWTGANELPVAWLTLDEGDNDSARFLAYLKAALESLPWPAGDEVASRWASLHLGASRSGLTALINELDGFQDDFVCVLDDYHLITRPEIHETLAFLLEHQPPRMHLVISTRGDPPLPLARLRARRQMVEIREGDLRFTVPETLAFLGRASDLTLSDEDAAALQERTEGWAAGLQLAALALPGRRDEMGAFLESFAGSHQYIAEYLQSEVLSQQAADVQRFLLQTSILERLSGSLCDAVTGRRGGRQSLKELRRMNLFVVSLDDEQRWYRYHSLFADLLRQRLARTMPEEAPILHKRACHWYVAHDRPASAIKHALAAGEKELAAELIAAAAEETLMRGELTTLVNWMEPLPREIVDRHQLLRVYHATALLFLGQPLEVVEPWLYEGDAAMDQLPAIALPPYAYIAILRGQGARAAELSRQALAHLPPEERFLRSLAIWLLNVAELRDSDPDASLRLLEGAARSVREIGNAMVTVLALCNQAELYMVQGQLHESQAIYRRALALAADSQGKRLPVAGAALSGLGELAREWNDLAAAERYLVEGIELTKQWAGPAALDAYFSLAHVRLSLGDAAAAEELLEEAGHIAERFDASEEDDWLVDIVRARLWLGLGRIGEVWSWARARGLDGESGPDLAVDLPGEDRSLEERKRKYEWLVLARLLLMEERPAEALSLLDWVRPLFQKRRRVRALIQTLNLTALAQQSCGRPTLALEALDEALALAEPDGHVRTFLDEGPQMARLLYRAAGRGPSPGYAGKLLALFPLSEATEATEATEAAEAPPSARAEEALIRPLSPRELEVLQLIAEGHSNREIANILVLSLSTVKVHTRSIYRKLDVNSRTQAVGRARSLDLL
jgi:LuxR family maltose regulon positive regulatory protein